MIHSIARRLVLLACCIFPLQVHASGRRPPNTLPDTLAVNAAILALADSLDYGKLGGLWAAPDGTCWLQFSDDEYLAMRRVEPSGRVATVSIAGATWNDVANPLAMLPGGDVLVNLVLRGRGVSQLVRVGAGRLKATGQAPWRFNDSEKTTLVDQGGVVHLFGIEDFLSRAYMRFSVTDSAVQELSRRLFRDTMVLVPDSGYKVIRLPGGAPWGSGSNTVMQWDSDGLVAGAATAAWKSESITAFRMRLPKCTLLAHTEFEAASVAHNRTSGIDHAGFHLVRSGSGYWLFVPTVDDPSAYQQRVLNIYSCQLDSELNPVRSTTIAALTARPFAEAPQGSKVEVTLFGYRGDPFVRTSSSSSLDQRAFILRFIAFAPDGRIYCTEMHDTLVSRQEKFRSGGRIPVVGGGDSVGPVSVYVPVYPSMIRALHIEGQPVVTLFVGTNGEVDSVVKSKSSGNGGLDYAVLAAAQKARFAGRAFKKGSHPIACDLTYRFSLRPTDVRVVEARLRQK